MMSAYLIWTVSCTQDFHGVTARPFPVSILCVSIFQQSARSPPPPHHESARSHRRNGRRSALSFSSTLTFLSYPEPALTPPPPDAERAQHGADRAHAPRASTQPPHVAAVPSSTPGGLRRPPPGPHPLGPPDRPSAENNTGAVAWSTVPREGRTAAPSTRRGHMGAASKGLPIWPASEIFGQRVSLLLWRLLQSIHSKNYSTVISFLCITSGIRGRARPHLWPAPPLRRAFDTCSRRSAVCPSPRPHMVAHRCRLG